MDNVEVRFELTLKSLEPEFGAGIDLQAILFLIGVQELGKGAKNFNKREKLEVLHIAVCRLLSEYSYYEFEGYDQDGWPHYKRTEKLPFLNPSEQELLMKEAVVNYFEKLN
ncbi:MAG: hypothetical protein KDC83_05890 [Flavobacteriales bacterium]|nr:hypothetical protein [Flavobacteriales bacterium]